jgi:hypothetical protein
MKHFDIRQWVDFARGIGTDADRAMQAHLAACRACVRTVEFLRQVSAVAAAERRYVAPDYLVRAAKAMFALQQPEKVQFRRLLARLVYDSFREPVPAGIRAQDRVFRHALYQAGNFYLDLRLEREKGSPLVALVGQLTNRKDPESSTAEIPVLLMAGKDIVGHAVSNRLGEFQMEYPPVPHLRLYVSLGPTGKRIELSLSRLMAEMAKRPEGGGTVLRRLGRKSAVRNRS